MPSLMGVLGLDANPFKSGLSQAQILANRAGNKIGSALTSQIAGFLSVAAVGQLARATVGWASKLNDVADAQRVNVEWLQKMVNGAELYGGTLEDVEKVLDSINKNRANPTKDSAAAMGRLGLGGSESLGPMAFFDKLSSRISKGFDSQSASDLEAIGGKSARNLLLAFSEQFKNDTPIISQEMVDQLDEIGDKFTELGTVLKVTLAPAILWAANAVHYLVQRWQRVAAFWGGAIGGGSLDAGAIERDRLIKEQEKADKDAEDARARMGEIRKQRQSQGLSPLDDLKAPKAAAFKSAIELNALQKVGAYVGMDPSRKEMTEMVRVIKKGVEVIAQNSQRQDSGGTTF